MKDKLLKQIEEFNIVLSAVKSTVNEAEGVYDSVQEMLAEDEKNIEKIKLIKEKLHANIEEKKRQTEMIEQLNDIRNGIDKLKELFKTVPNFSNEYVDSLTDAQVESVLMGVERNINMLEERLGVFTEIITILNDMKDFMKSILLEDTMEIKA